MKMLSMLTLLWLGAFVAQAAAGGNCCCNDCGCPQVKKVCRLVTGSTKVTTFRWDVKCEDFCLPGKSDICGTHCVPDCESHHGCRKEIIWQPHCSCKIRTKRTLVKIPVTKEVPTYTCVVECVCCRCGVAKLDPAATELARAQGIMPASAEEPIVLEEQAATADELAAATNVPPAKKQAASFIGALFGK